MSPGNTLADLLAALARVMPECCERWYLFGAQAVQVWGAPRLTADVDVTVGQSDLKPLFEKELTAIRGERRKTSRRGSR